MKQYFLKTAGTLSLLALAATGAFAQEDAKPNPEKDKAKKSEDVIIIRPKVDVNTKVTVEVNGEDIKINGKPLSEFKDDNVSITITKDRVVGGRATVTARSRFRSNGGGTYFSGPDDDNYAFTPGHSFKLATTDDKRAFLGVGTEKADDGARVVSVSDESGADKAGIKKGDVITKLNDTKITNQEDLSKAVGKLNPDDKVTITYKRDKKEQKTTATLGKRKMNGAITFAPSDNYAFKEFKFDNDAYSNNYALGWSGKARLGLKAQETEDGKGLKVLDVDDESVAEKAGIQEGDIITEFDGKEVNNIDTLREVSRDALTKNNFKVKLTRDGKAQEVEVKIPKKLKSTSL
ncbi:MAG: PDZ domain-containing protein [Chitinophagaceae bacterium]